MFNVTDILMWKNPAITGGILAAFNALFIMVEFYGICFVHLACQMAILVIFVGLALKFVMPSAVLVDEASEPISKDAIAKVVGIVASGLNVATTKTIETVTWKRSSTTLKALVGIDVVRRLALWISLTYVIFLAGNSVFIIPYVVETKWDMLESHIKKVYEVKDLCLSKVPKYTDCKDVKWD